MSRIQVLKGVMFISREHRTKVKYTVRNADTEARQVVIEHPVRAGWKLAEGSKPEETTASYYRFRVTVEPSKTGELTVEEVHSDTTTAAAYRPDRRSGGSTGGRRQRITPELQAVFRKVLDQKNVISGLQAQIESRQQELNTRSTGTRRAFART